MTGSGFPSYEERLQLTAAATRDVLVHTGAARWEIFAKASSVRQVQIERDQPLQTIHTEEVGVAVRTVRGGRCGFAAASGLEAETSRRAVDGALGCERPHPVDPLPPSRLLGTIEPPTRRAVPAPGWPAHVTDELGRSLGGYSQGRLELARCVFQTGSFSWILSTSEGFVATFADCTSALLVELLVRGDGRGVWRQWMAVADPDGFEPETVARRLADRVLLTRLPLCQDSGSRDLIVHGEVVAHLLAALSPLFTATPGIRDMIPRLVRRDGQLASPELSLVDDRSGQCGAITGPCDGEGLPARRTLLVENGVPRHRLASYRDSILCGEMPRGGALRLSYRDYPRSRLANLHVLTDGGVSPGELLGLTSRALYLLRPLAAVEVDAAADRYRIHASGVWLDRGRPRGWHPVVEVRGSVGQLLRRIDAVGTDLDWYQTEAGVIGAPTLLIRRQPVVAAG